MAVGQLLERPCDALRRLGALVLALEFVITAVLRDPRPVLCVQRTRVMAVVGGDVAQGVAAGEVDGSPDRGAQLRDRRALERVDHPAPDLPERS